VLGGALAEEKVKTIWLHFFAVVEQQMKKCTEDKRLFWVAFLIWG